METSNCMFVVLFFRRRSGFPGISGPLISILSQQCNAKTFVPVQTPVTWRSPGTCQQTTPPWLIPFLRPFPGSRSRRCLVALQR
ncbi:hypothetical protein Y1Q_0019030 [Alligator mississippiensis]|uniref:Uncharacterized protein n=1 Tax=Alligator mississippiensis TaxID=8496 RepID=A0A151P065_ALLMI|nr:hypothetical protein Y1Q_0019030 [Alligator mississippiensis]